MAVSSKMNPQISTIEIGVRKLREVTVYPLSAADQFKMTKLITEIVQEMAKGGDLKEGEDVTFVKVIVQAIEDNLAQILKFVLDPSEKISFEEITNVQLMDLVTLIFEMNYEGVIKNLRALLERGKLMWTSKESSVKSSEKPLTD